MVFLKILQNSQENTCARDSFLKKPLAQVFSCEFFKISKNTSLTEHLRTTASDFIYDTKSQRVKFLWLYKTWFMLFCFMALKAKNKKFLWLHKTFVSFYFASLMTFRNQNGTFLCLDKTFIYFSLALFMA